MIAVNAAPILMPPTWIILSSFYALDSSLDPVVLALVGATGATIGRLFLKRISDFSEDLWVRNKNQTLTP